MAGKLFNIYSGNTGGVLSTSTAKVGSFGTTSDDFYSVNFDTGRKSIWTNNIEFGRAADWGNISGIPSWIESDGVTWAKVKDKPATATRWPYWSEILSKPAAIGSATQPVYWDGSTFQLVNSVAPATHDHDTRYLKLTGGTLSGDLAFSHGSSANDQHITWASGTNYQRLKVRDGQTDVFIFQYSTDSGTTWSDYFTIQNGTAKIGTYTVYHSGNLPAYPTVNNGSLYLQANGTTKVTFYANQSSNSTFNIATGSSNGTISVGSTDVAVKGLGSNAYSSTDYLPLAGGQMTGNISWKNSTALPEQSSPQYFLVIDAFADGGATKWSSKANTLNALTGLTSTAKGTTSKPLYWDGSKFVECLAYSQASVNYANSAGSVDWSNVQNKPSSFAPSAHDHTYLKKNFKSTGITNIPFTGEQFEYGILTGATTGVVSPEDLTAFDSYSQVEYINLPWYSDLYGGQLMFGANSGKIGYRTIHNGTWSVIKEIIHSGNYTNYTVKKDGTGATGTWGISISGNAATATKLQTARTITINGSSKTFDGTGNISWSLEDLNLPSNDHNHDGRYLKLTGGTLTGVLHLLGSQYADTAGTGALDLANSDIYGVNSIKFADLSDGAGEGLQWYRDATHTDSLWVKNGVIYFTPNRTWGGTGTDYTVYHTGNLTAATLLGSTAKGSTSKPIYWDGSKIIECLAYSQASVNYANSAGNADTVDSKHASDFVYTAQVSEEQNSDVNTWAQNNADTNKRSLIYNTSGREWSYLSSLRNDGAYGAVIKFGYNDGHPAAYIKGKSSSSWYSGWVQFITSDNIGSQSVNYATSAGSANYATSAGNADTLDTFHATDLFQTFTNDATTNAVKIKIGNNEKSLVVGYATKANSANSADGSEYLNYYSVSDPNTAYKDHVVKWFSQISGNSGYAGTNYGFPISNNANGVLWLGTHSGNYGGQIGISSNGNIYYRYISAGNFSTAANGASWQVLLTSNNYTTITDARYVKKAGDTMTGLLTTASGDSHDGIKVGNTYINAINGELILQNNSAIRFGGDSWDYNVWAGLKYVHSSKTIYLGLADGSSFTANSAQSGGKLYLPGISNLYTGNGANLIWHSGNDGSGSGLDADLLDGKHADDFLYRLRRTNLNASSNYVGMIPPAILELKSAGYPLYTDPEFASGNNGIYVYNNSGGSDVTITRIDDNQTSGNSSGKILKIHSSSGTASPYGGGFYFATGGTVGKIHVCIFRAKIPSGYEVYWHSNSTGSGANKGWLTSVAGTGKWEWYAHIVEWGSSPSSTFFFTLNKKENVDWYLSYANVIDISQGNYDGLRTRYADHATSSDSASSVAWANITGKATSKTAWGQTFVDSSGNIQSISGNMTSVGQVTPDGNATRDNGTSSANWATVYSYALRSNDNLTLRSGTSKDIIFQTNAGTEHMRLTSGGNLGIGTNSPAYKLHVKGSHKIEGGSLGIYPTGGNYNDGIRIHARSADNTWAAITFCAFDNTGDTGISVNSWFVGNNSGNFYITKNGSSSSSSAILYCSSNKWYINTTSGSEILNVGGWIGTVGNTGWYSITHGGGWYMDNSTYIKSYNSKSVYTGGGMYGNGFYHIGNQSNDYVILGNGGTKQWSASKTASTIVARTGDNFVYAGYYNSDISNEDSISVGSVYVRNTSDNFIRRQSIGKFADNLRSNEIISIDKSLTVTEAWMDTGIVCDTTTFPRGTGTYAVQIKVNSSSSDGWSPCYSGIMTIFTENTNGDASDEVPLHVTGHATEADSNFKRIYIKTIEQFTTSGNPGHSKIQIAASQNMSASHTYTFKFRKLI